LGAIYLKKNRGYLEKEWGPEGLIDLILEFICTICSQLTSFFLGVLSGKRKIHL
jgi:hypothetical protein